MQVFGLFSIMLAVAAAQAPQYYRNPGFRNSATPLMPAASKERPYLSIPIVLMPDGQIVPKAQASYQYVSAAPAQPQQRNPKSRGPVMTGETADTYQVVVPPPPSFAQDQKQEKPSKNGVSGRTMVAAKEQRGYVQNPQQNYPPKYHHQNDRTQSASLVQFQNQRNPSGQQHVASNQQGGEAHRQNVANFLNFATHLGTEVLSHHRGGQKNLYFNQPPAAAADAHQGSHGMQKAQETYVMQAPPSQDQSNGFTYAQAQVQQSSAPQGQQVSQKANVAQHNMHNVPQMQYQSTPAPQPVQYVQASNVRQSNQGQAGNQNQATSVQQSMGSAVYFPGNQNNPSQITGHIQSSQQAGNQNYQLMQQGAPNVQLIPAKNYEPQTQIMYAPQPVIEMPSQGTNTQAIHPNYGMAVQSGPAYVVDGHQVSFANAGHVSPPTFQTQQNYQNSQQVPQSQVEQARSQNMYASHQNAQDAGSSYPANGNHQQHISSVQHGQQQINSQQPVRQSSPNSASNQNEHANQNGQPTYRNQPQTYAGHNAQSYETGAYTYASTQPTYSPTAQSNHAKYATPTPASSNYQEYQYEYSTEGHRDETKLPQQESASPNNGGQVIYASSSAKQINYTPSAQESGQSQNNPDQSSAYVSFPSSYKPESSQGDAVSSESTYAKQAQSGHSSEVQLRATSEDEDVETSYKVVYIPLDILKNILSNSVENQRVEKSS
ncbi:hypothetical protein AVEN_225705-1 [Araneus ventricosus]|uniref:Uncharacterized protein n=1 Tax=Araneus ventricosus TaxID=182803 RepID=A0A4Y2FVW7_ARAVE|nr:hypothetical protein AVEN_225705-1 [Araneus ventricosus]